MKSARVLVHKEARCLRAGAATTQDSGNYTHYPPYSCTHLTCHLTDILCFAKRKNVTRGNCEFSLALRASRAEHIVRTPKYTHFLIWNERVQNSPKQMYAGRHKTRPVSPYAIYWQMIRYNRSHRNNDETQLALKLNLTDRFFFWYENISLGFCLCIFALFVFWDFN